MSIKNDKVGALDRLRCLKIHRSVVTKIFFCYACMINEAPSEVNKALDGGTYPG